MIGNQSIFDKFGDKLRHSKTLARSFERYIPFYPFSEGCKSIIADLYCRYLFPLCDTTLSTPYPRHICRKSCEFALHVICKDDLTRFKEIAQRDPDFDPNLINVRLIQWTAEEKHQNVTSITRYQVRLNLQEGTPKNLFEGRDWWCASYVVKSLFYLRPKYVCFKPDLKNSVATRTNTLSACSQLTET